MPALSTPKDGKPRVNTVIKRGKDADQFVLATEHSIQWARSNRQTTYLVAGIAIVLLIAIAIGYSIYEHRTAEAQTAFGQAMQTYQTPVTRPDQPLPPGMKAFKSTQERAARANGQFEEVAHRFNLTEPGKLALYFAGITYMEEGQNGQAEDTLQKVAKSWNADTAALAKMALAQLYQQTGRNDQAVTLYEQLAKGHAATVPPDLAQLQLAALYTSEGKTEEARHIYAELKDHDKDAQGKPGVAAQIASEKLNPQPAAPALPGQ